MEKYRVRLQNARVLGPFEVSQILEMKTKGHVGPEAECQLFPTGDWKPISSFDFWRKQGQQEATGNHTFVIDLNDLKDKSSPDKSSPHVEVPKQEFREFGYKQLISEQEKELVAKIAVEIHPEFDLDGEVIKANAEVKTAQPEEDNSDKTRVTPEGQIWKQEQEKKKNAEKRLAEQSAKNKSLEPLPEKRIDYQNESTQMISLGSAVTVSNAEIERAELELEGEAEQFAKARKKTRPKEVTEEEEKPKESKKKITIGALLLIVLLALLFPEEDPKVVKKADFVPMDPSIEFPIPFDVKDEGKFKENYEKAERLLSAETIPAKIEAAKHYRMAFENDTTQKKALARFIRLSGELLPHSGFKEMDGGTLFKLLQSNRSLQDIDPDVALGASLFYRAQDKKEAGFEVLDRFVKSKTNNPTKELFAAYLIGLCDKNDEVKADEVAKSFSKLPEKNIAVSLALIHYHRYKNHLENAKVELGAALANHPQSVPLLISFGELALESMNMKQLLDVVKRIAKEGAEGSRIYYGRMLEFQGFILAFQGKPGEATKKFSESLKYVDSETLRDKLVNVKGIEDSTNSEAVSLIRQIQARELTKKSQLEMQSFDFENGLLDAIKAHSLKSGYVKADLNLAEIQMRLGMSKEALETLDQLQKQNPNDRTVNFTLLKAYIDTYKFFDSKKILVVMASSDMKDDWRYASLNARMYEKMGDINQSILWLQKAINMNPLEDENLYRLSKLFLKAKKFEQSKNNLFKAMELNPSLVEYKLAYANIIYEIEGPDRAVDYLYGLLKQIPDNPSILGEIAIYYHRAGKLKEFNDVKKEIEKLKSKDSRVYRFMIQTAILDERWNDAIKFTNNLLDLEPGDLNAMMEIGKTLMQVGKYKESAQWFVRLKDKLPSYPMVGYYKAKIELYVGNKDQALKDVQDDMSMNGEYEDGVNLVGDIMFLNEDFNKSEGEYKKALRINPRSYGALKGLADIAVKRDQLDIALDLYKRAAAEKKGEADPYIYRQLGEVYRLMGQGSLAIESYQIYLKLLPDASDKAKIEQYIKVLE